MFLTSLSIYTWAKRFEFSKSDTQLINVFSHVTFSFEMIKFHPEMGRQGPCISSSLIFFFIIDKNMTGNVENRIFKNLPISLTTLTRKPLGLRAAFWTSNIFILELRKTRGLGKTHVELTCLYVQFYYVKK